MTKVKRGNRVFGQKPFFFGSIGSTYMSNTMSGRRSRMQVCTSALVTLGAGGACCCTAMVWFLIVSRIPATASLSAASAASWLAVRASSLAVMALNLETPALAAVLERCRSSW